MPRPSDTALKNRARTLLEAMTERQRWIYAIPAAAFAAARAEAEAAGMQVAELDEPDGEGDEGAQPPVGELGVLLEGNGFTIELEVQPDLEVVVLEGNGEGAVPVISAILAKTGFFAQSQLLAVAHEIGEPEAPEALGTLATMVVSWDAEWAKLFGLHLASSSPDMRGDAAASLAEAAIRAGASTAVRPIIERAVAAEQHDETRARMTEALARLATP
jgi:hypothetical protein